METALTTLWVLFCVAGIGAIFAVPIYFGMRKGRVLKVQADAVKALYDKGLSDLQQDPENSEKYQKVLQLGREYYAFGNRRGDPNVQNVIETRLQSEIQASLLKRKAN